MQIFKDFSLQNYNTFNVDSKAKSFALIETYSDFINLYNNINKNNQKLYFLGNGSNILLTKDIESIVIHNKIKEINILQEDNENVFIEVSSGTNWHSFVEFCLENNFYGLENLALIPGSVGAAPVQNIGAYGAEQKDFFESLTVFDFNSGKSYNIFLDECGFDYRYSKFKTNEFSNLFITKVQYKLKKKFIPNINYKDILNYFTKIPNFKPENIEPQMVFDAICEIRNKKLPDYTIEPNAGSFFKNPLINKNTLENLLKIFPEMNYYEQNLGLYKISAAFLIEKAGWKGKKIGKVSVSDKHSLVLINRDKASGKEVEDFSEFIINDIFVKFQIKLVPEVIFW